MIKYIFVILFGISFFECFLRQVHMFQLNHYKNSFQISWIKKNKKKLLLNTALYILAIIMYVLNIKWVSSISVIAIYGILIFTNISKKAKKPLVYTNRVKRLIIVAALLITLVSIITYNLCDFSGMFIAMLIMNILVPLFVFICNIINIPINKAINNWYINDAKRIIKEMPNLITIGVTGSYGKTSVKTFLYKLLSAKYNVLIAPENYNTELGVTRTIREHLRATHEIFVCEMGADEVGEIKSICDIVHPKYGVITSIGPQHLETFGSMQNIINTKFELEQSLPEDGIVFLNYDNEYIINRKIDRKVVKYGINNTSMCDYFAYDISTSNKGLSFKIKDLDGQEYTFETKLIGSHNVLNLVGAISVARNLGIPMRVLVQRVRTLESVPHRLQVIKRGNDVIIDDAYNSNPSGSSYALDALSEFDGLKILVTPGMIELGEKQYECNYNFGVKASKICDYIVLVGKEQTKPIYEGVLSTEYNKQNLIVTDDINEGLDFVWKIKSYGKSKIVLLENDLPDNY